MLLDRVFELDLLKKIEKIIEDYGFFLGGVIPLGSQDDQEHAQIKWNDLGAEGGSGGRDPEFSLFKRWLEEGRHGSMRYLERHQDIREFPKRIDPQMKTAIVIGLSYGTSESKPKVDDGARVAQYARYGDYHRVFWRLGPMMLEKIHSLLKSPNAVGRVLCDSAPLLERSLAVRAGIGFRGKNTCVINPERGSLFFIGELLTSLDMSLFFEKKPLSRERSCGSCRRCQVHCPTGALDQEYRMDARKCIAYWTIEHRGPIPKTYWSYVGMYVFGCDICQLVCPFNRILRPFGQAAPTMAINTPLQPRTPKELDLFGVATMNQQQYEAWFGGTPLTRAKREGLMRNALIALFVKEKVNCARAVAFLNPWNETPPVLRETLHQVEQSLNMP